MEFFGYRGYTIEVNEDLDAPDPRTEFDFYSDEEVTAWENGEVYGYTSRDPNGNEIDSCWGFYGCVDYMMAEARRQIDAHIAAQARKHEMATIAGL